jgi:CO/xanthine dehydrogenase FAD-binding subunit
LRSNAADYDILTPGTLQGALDLLAEGNIAPIAGGTELMVALGAGRLAQKRFVSLQDIRDLRFFDETPDTLRIGAGTTFTDLRGSAVIARDFPLMAQTASWTGSIANQNRGTLGGNIANASPAADTPPALLVYEAELELVSARGTRTVPYADFHLGYKRTALASGELILAVRLPRRFRDHTHFVRKVGTRNAQAISKIALACVSRMEDGVFHELRLAAASLHDRPIRLRATEQATLHQALTPGLIRRAQEAMLTEAAPIDDIRSTARYRAAVAANLLEEALQHAAEAQGCESRLL